MNIQDLGAIGEFVASIAVLITLISLTVETRKNTAELKRTNVKHTASEYSEALYSMMDSEITDIFHRGMENLEALSKTERLRCDMTVYAWLSPIEQAFADHALGNYPDESLNVFRNAVPNVLTAPGGRKWWDERQMWFSGSFRKIVNELINRPPEESGSTGVFSQEG